MRDLLKARGLTTSRLAELAAIEPASLLLDIDAHDDELEDALDASSVVKIGTVLGGPFWDLMNIRCSKCGGTHLRVLNSDPRSVGARIQAERVRRQIGADELAQSLGYSNLAFVDWLEKGEEGLDNMPLEDVRQFAAALDMSVAEVLGLCCYECSAGTAS